MKDIILCGRILWGNSAGIRISHEDLRETGLRIDQEADLQLLRPDGKVDLAGRPVARARAGPRDVARRHDEYIAKALDEKLKRRGPFRSSLL